MKKHAIAIALLAAAVMAGRWSLIAHAGQLAQICDQQLDAKCGGDGPVGGNPWNDCASMNNAPCEEGVGRSCIGDSSDTSVCTGQVFTTEPCVGQHQAQCGWVYMVRCNATEEGCVNDEPVQEHDDTPCYIDECTVLNPS